MSGITVGTSSSTSATSAPTASGMAPGQPQPATNQGGKVKQTRRRQRLSCVECTKRRQVSHLILGGEVEQELRAGVRAGS